MSKFLYLCGLAATTFLIIGSYVLRDDVIMWFAGTSDAYNIVRVGLSLLLILLLIIEPPRRLFWRVILATVSVGLAVWTVAAFEHDALHVLDGVLYVQLSVLYMLAALEISYAEYLPPIVSPHAPHKLTPGAKKASTEVAV